MPLLTFAIGCGTSGVDFLDLRARVSLVSIGSRKADAEGAAGGATAGGGRAEASSEELGRDAEVGMLR